MNIDSMTIGELKEISKLINKDSQKTLNFHVGKKVIIRTYSAGVWFGTLKEKEGKEVILRDARRMYFWKAKKSISLSGVAKYGIDQEESKICPKIDNQWLEAIEIMELSNECIKSIEEAKDVEAS